MTTRATSTSPAGPTPHPWRSLGLAATGLAVVGAVLWWTGNALPGPSSYDRGGFATWLGETDPVVAAFAVIRLLGLGLVAWALLTGALALVANRTRLRRRRRLRRLIDRLCFPVVRRLVHGAAGVAVAAATIAPGAAGATTDGGPRQFATVMAIEDVATTTTTTTPTTTITVAGPAVSPTVPPTAPAPTTTVAASPAGAAGPAVAGPTTPTTIPAPGGAAQMARIVALDPAPDPLRPSPDRTVAATASPADTSPRLSGTWELRAGEHLWHVAQATLTGHLGRSPDDEETSAYLRVLVEANDHRLVVPGNPDLVLAGQLVELPDPAGLSG